VEDIFITGVHIEKFRNIEKLSIDLSKDKRKHLIITGKNGSGKTSLLDLLINNFDHRFTWDRWDVGVHYETTTDLFDLVEIYSQKIVGSVGFSKRADILKVLMIGMPAEHLFRVSEPHEATSFSDRYGSAVVSKPKEYLYHNILDTMRTMRIQQLEAKESNDQELFSQSEKWLGILKRVLRTVHESKSLDLIYVAKERKYKIVLDGYEFDFMQMADGFSAFFRIASEIMERMDCFTEYKCDYSLPGIVFIDELETHMHISMQKMALGFLTEMFPNVQFIVTTHSPFIITSLDNAIVYDLSKRESLENSSQYSYESIIEGYYDIDMYSEKMKEKFNRYKELAFSERTSEEKIEFSKLRVELQAVSPAQKEIYIAFSDIEKKRKLAEHG